MYLIPQFLFSWMCFHIHISDLMDIHIHINLSRGNVGMPHHFLDAFQICPVLEQMGRKGMPESMWSNILLDPC